MATYLIAMSSVTYANKAYELMKSNGYNCGIERTPKNLASGCGYSLRISGEIETIAALLNTKGIAPRDVMKIGDESG